MLFVCLGICSFSFCLFLTVGGWGGDQKEMRGGRERVSDGWRMIFIYFVYSHPLPPIQTKDKICNMKI